MFEATQERAHFLALASSTTAMAGLRFDDIKWFISTLVSLFGTCAALRMFSRRTKRDNREETNGRPQ